MAETAALERLAQTVLQGLAAGQPVEIQHLGVFHPDPACGFRFEPRSAPQVFLAYVTEDAAAACRGIGGTAERGKGGREALESRTAFTWTTEL